MTVPSNRSRPASAPRGAEAGSAHLVSVEAASVCLSAWTATTGDAEALAEALYEARPQWRISIDGRQVVFSREGKIADFV